MDDDRFWQLIAETGGEFEALKAALIALDEQAIIDFDRIFKGGSATPSAATCGRSRT